MDLDQDNQNKDSFNASRGSQRTLQPISEHIEIEPEHFHPPAQQQGVPISPAQTTSPITAQHEQFPPRHINEVTYISQIHYVRIFLIGSGMALLAQILANILYPMLGFLGSLIVVMILHLPFEMITALFSFIGSYFVGSRLMRHTNVSSPKPITVAALAVLYGIYVITKKQWGYGLLDMLNHVEPTALQMIFGHPVLSSAVYMIFGGVLFILFTLLFQKFRNPMAGPVVVACSLLFVGGMIAIPASDSVTGVSDNAQKQLNWPKIYPSYLPPDYDMKQINTCKNSDEHKSAISYECEFDAPDGAKSYLDAKSMEAIKKYTEAGGSYKLQPPRIVVTGIKSDPTLDYYKIDSNNMCDILGLSGMSSVSVQYRKKAQQRDPKNARKCKKAKSPKGIEVVSTEPYKITKTFNSGYGDLEQKEEITISDGLYYFEKDGVVVVIEILPPATQGVTSDLDPEIVWFLNPTFRNELYKIVDSFQK